MLLVCKVINVVTWLRGYWCHCINHSTAFSKQLTAVEFVFFFFFFGRSISSRALEIPSFRVLEWSWASGFPENLLLLRLFSPLCLDFIYQYLSLDSVTKEHISLPCFPFFFSICFRISFSFGYSFSFILQRWPLWWKPSFALISSI